MKRRNDYDVANRVKTTDPVAVNREVGGIFTRLYPNASTRILDRAFKDIARLHHGEYPGYQACDVGYHNLQHTLDVTLAMARLMDGHERSPDRGEALGAKLFGLGVLTALYHDIGYLRRSKDRRYKSGAAYTLVHITRGTQFLRTYMGKLGLADLAHTLTMAENGVIPPASARDLVAWILALGKRPVDFVPAAQHGDLYTNREAWLIERTAAVGWLGVARARRDVRRPRVAERGFGVA